MEDEEDGETVRGMKVGEQGVKFLLAPGIDTIGRLVESKDMGISREGAGDQHPLLLTS